jgi:RNA polymerase sigma factor (sigma-70 family)
MSSAERLTYSGPLCLYLPQSVYAWIDAIAHRTNANPYEELRAEADRLILFYADQLGTQPSANGTSGWASYQGRLATGLLYHWWRFSEKQVGIPSLADVVRLVQSRRLAYGRVDQDVLSEIVIAEGYCQRDSAAADHFLKDYSLAIAAAARHAGGRRAEHELEDLAAEMILPRGERPPKLALYSGQTPLVPWLRVVVRHEWQSHERRHGRTSSWDDDRGQQTPDVTSERPIGEHECLEILQPLFTRAAAGLSPRESLLLRMIFLDGKQQNALALFWKVNKSTVSRQVSAARDKLVSSLWTLASLGARPEGTKDCLEWFKDAPSASREILGGALAESLRSKSAETTRDGPG